MSEKTHQQSNTEYQVRINGMPILWYSNIHKDLLLTYAQVCADHPNDYVDVVAVRTEILMNQHTYMQMKKHFCN